MTGITITPITDDEIAALNLTDLDRKAPFVITSVTGSMFSTARHYGGMKFRGFEYDLNAIEDALYRRDVVKWLKSHRRAATNTIKALDLKKMGTQPGLEI